MPCKEYDGHRRTKFAQAILQLRSAQSRHPHVKKDTARHIFGPQTVQHLQRRRIGRNLVTGVLQTTFHRGPEGRVVVNNMHKPGQWVVPDFQLTTLNYAIYAGIPWLECNNPLLKYDNSVID